MAALVTSRLTHDDNRARDLGPHGSQGGDPEAGSPVDRWCPLRVPTRSRSRLGGPPRAAGVCAGAARLQVPDPMRARGAFALALGCLAAARVEAAPAVVVVDDEVRLRRGDVELALALGKPV